MSTVHFYTTLRMSVINVFFFLYSLQCKNTLIIYQLNLITMLFILDIKIHL